jgi:hypothetical protein
MKKSMKITSPCCHQRRSVRYRTERRMAFAVAFSYSAPLWNNIG